MKKLALAAIATVLMAAGTPVYADGSKNIREFLTGYEEAPLAISTTGNGEFRARISKDQTEISYELSYAGLEGDVLQAHIHFGLVSVTGGISVFLCSNLGNGPAGTQACPPSPAKITGTFRAADVIGPTGQGIEPGALAELLAAIRAGTTYVNVHTTKWPSGEIRSQIDGHRGHGD